MGEPLFVVGQSVRYRSKQIVGAGSSYIVAQVMPSEGRNFVYRLKGSNDAFMRVASEHELDEDRAETLF